MTPAPPPPRKPWYRILYIQVLIAVVAGILIGHLDPELGKKLHPLGVGFVRLVKMIIAPIIFCTVVHGIASMQDMRKLGRIGLKALIYFEVISTLALIIGLVVVNWLQPGVGFTPDQAAVSGKDAELVKSFARTAQNTTVVDFLLGIVPQSFFEPFVTSNLLQILLVSTLAGFAIVMMGEKGRPIVHAIETGSKVFFGIMHIVVKVAPIAALGAMGYTVGSYGIGALNKLLVLMLGFYVTAGFFVVVVLGAVAWMAGFSVFRMISYIREEIFLVLGTSSSETALPGMLEKLRRLGCAETTVGFVIPTGYSFNLDGTNIYMTMAAIFLAQATNTALDLKSQIALLLVAMVSSKGASGVTGSGFITLAGTLAAVPSIPIESMAFLLGIDRFMSECRAITNLIGNGVATIVVSRWEGEVTPAQLNENLRAPRSIVDLPPGTD